MPRPDHTFLLLRRQNPDGTSADWAVAVIDGGLWVRHGKTGAAMPAEEIPRKSWTAQSAWEEADKRRRTKQQNKPYEIQGLSRFSAEDRLEIVTEDKMATVPVHTSPAKTDPLTGLPVNESPAPSDTPARPSRRDASLFWDITASNWTDLATLMERALDQLKGKVDATLTWANREGLPTAVPMVGNWSLDFPTHKGLGPVRHAGRLQGSENVAALLYMLTLRQLAEAEPERDVLVNLADRNGKDISANLREEDPLFQAFGSTLLEIERTAEDIGIVPKILRLAEIHVEEQPDMWF